MNVASVLSPGVDPLDALTDLISAHRGAIVRAARSEGIAAEDAVEVAHDAFCTFFQIARRGEAPESTHEWPAYVATIAKNAAKNRRRRHDVARPHDEVDSVPLADPSRNPEDDLAAAEEHVRLHACIERLCGTQKSVVMLRMLDERDGIDVAAALGITRGHVDVLLLRAKASLRACMSE
jgi:RNA polymerase sigma-70 factor (ECF subfamily)